MNRERFAWKSLGQAIFISLKSSVLTKSSFIEWQE
jgi:hypothetical protein